MTVPSMARRGSGGSVGEAAAVELARAEAARLKERAAIAPQDASWSVQLARGGAVLWLTALELEAVLGAPAMRALLRKTGAYRRARELRG